MAGLFGNYNPGGPGGILGAQQAMQPQQYQQQPQQFNVPAPPPGMAPMANFAYGMKNGSGIIGSMMGAAMGAQGVYTDPAMANMVITRQMVQGLQQAHPDWTPDHIMAVISDPKVREQLYGIQSMGGYETPSGWKGQVVNNQGKVGYSTPTPQELATMPGSTAMKLKPGEQLYPMENLNQNLNLLNPNNAQGGQQAQAQGGAEQQPGYTNNSGMLSPTAIALQGDRAMNGDFSVFQSNRGEIGQLSNNAILNYMASKGASAQQLAQAKSSFENQQKATKDFGTGKQGDAVRSFSVALDHADLFKNLAQAMGNGDIRALNEIKNVWTKEFNGSPLPTNVNAAKQILSAEIAKAVQGADVAQGDREHLQEALNSANSWKQLSGVVDSVYTPLMAGQIKGLRRQYLQNTKQAPAEFDNLLSPRAFQVTHGFKPEAAAALRANPSLRDQFEQKYGAGSAADILGQ